MRKLSDKMNTKVKKKLVLPEKLRKRILEDNDFSLRLALYTGQKQATVERQVKRNSYRLLTPMYMRFYEENGYPELHKICKK